jgi:hypothetical protein
MCPFPAPPLLKKGSQYELAMLFLYSLFHTSVNPILHAGWLNNHTLTLQSNTAKCYFGGKSSLLQTFLKFWRKSRKIEVKLKNSFVSLPSLFKKVNFNV